MVSAGILAYAVVAALAVTLVLRTTPDRPPALGSVDLSETGVERGETPYRDRTLRVAVAAMANPDETFIAYRDVVSYLGRAVGMRGELVVRSTYAEVNQLVESGAVDVAFICSGAYVMGRREGRISLLAAPVVGGETVYYAYVIVPEESRVDRLRDLGGATFASVDVMSNTGWIAPRCALAREGLDPDTFFSDVVFTHSHDRSVVAVATGVVDGASVDSLIFDAMLGRDDAYAKHTRIVERIGPFGMPPVVVPATLDPSVREDLSQAILSMHADPSGREALGALGVDRFRVPDAQEYDSVEQCVAKAASRPGEAQ